MSFKRPSTTKSYGSIWHSPTTWGPAVAVGYAGSFAFNTAKNYVEDD